MYKIHYRKEYDNYKATCSDFDGCGISTNPAEALKLLKKEIHNNIKFMQITYGDLLDQMTDWARTIDNNSLYEAIKQLNSGEIEGTLYETHLKLHLYLLDDTRFSYMK